MGKILVIAEKPSVARDIAKVLQAKQKGEGCLIGERYVVSWAVGHLVTLVEPDELDEKYKRWSFDTLPILPAEIPLKVIASSRDHMIHVCDTDQFTGRLRQHLCILGCKICQFSHRRILFQNDLTLTVRINFQRVALPDPQRSSDLFWHNNSPQFIYTPNNTCGFHQHLPPTSKFSVLSLLR